MANGVSRITQPSNVTPVCLLRIAATPRLCH
jgi:hypothetical protein